MKELVNGISVEGTPEEIAKYIKLSEQNKVFFNLHIDFIPEHVKNYSDSTAYQVANKGNKLTAWY